MNQQNFGAKPPSQLAWQIGKTAASIRFVIQAEALIASSKDTFAIGLLTDEINRIKSGEVVLSEFVSPHEFVLRAQQG